MLRTRLIWAATALFSTVNAATGSAGSLQVAPVTLELVAPAAATSLRLKNSGSAKLVAQVRVFKWAQENGADALIQTDDLAASPPVVTMDANGEAVIRLVNVAPSAVTAPEGTYRVVIDELPDRSRQRPGTVALVLRHSIPVFVRQSGAGAPRVAFAIEKAKGKSYLKATNSGTRRIRLARMSLDDGAGNTHSFGQGLNGYVLAGSVAKWPLPAGSRPVASNRPLTVSAETDVGPLNETVAR